MGLNRFYNINIVFQFTNIDASASHNLDRTFDKELFRRDLFSQNEMLTHTLIRYSEWGPSFVSTL